MPGFEDSFTDLNIDSVAKRVIPQPVSQLKSLYLPHTVLDCDLLVSLPKMKTHHWAGATLAMKNLFGLVPGGVYGWPKNVLHWAGIPGIDRRSAPSVPAAVRHRRRNRGDGRKRPDSGDAQSRRECWSPAATSRRWMPLAAGSWESTRAKIEYLEIARGAENLNEANFRQTGEAIASVKTNFALLDVWKEIRA